jgi:uncharacterized metal-binding protein
MPLGSTHDRITLWTAPAVTLAAGLLARSSTVALTVGSAYLFSGLMFSGDLDLYSRQYQRWLCLRWIWLPYRKLMRHRSHWSHGPVVGTLGRLLYLGIWLASLALLIAAIGSWQNLWPWQPLLWRSWLHQQILRHLELLLWVSIGLELGSVNHSLSDWIGSAWKRWRKSRNASQQLRKSRQLRKSGSEEQRRPQTFSSRSRPHHRNSGDR